MIKPIKLKYLEQTVEMYLLCDYNKVRSQSLVLYIGSLIWSKFIQNCEKIKNIRIKYEKRFLFHILFIHSKIEVKGLLFNTG